MKPRIFFSGLNGLRAIAALAVIFSHTTRGLDQFGLDAFVFGQSSDGNPKTTLLAGFGVSMFFTLSGFLITYLLLEEQHTTEINIKNFYLRRILRIWPLYYLYFALVILTLIVFDIPSAKTSILYYILLAANVPFILGQAILLLEHYWSLGVEEQFYSFWPWIIKKSKRLLLTTTLICLGLILLKIILRFIDIKTRNGNIGLLYETLHVTRFHCMLIGAIGAILYHQKHALFLKFTNNLVAQLLSWFIILLAAINKFHFASFIDNEIISFVSLVLIIGQIEKSKRIINLNVSFFDFIGKISYGVYVIHPLVIFYLPKVIHFNERNIYNYLVVYCTVFCVTIAVANASYFYF